MSKDKTPFELLSESKANFECSLLRNPKGDPSSIAYKIAIDDTYFFSGTGKTKEEAKNAAAEKALAFLKTNNEDNINETDNRTFLKSYTIPKSKNVDNEEKFEALRSLLEDYCEPDPAESKRSALKFSPEKSKVIKRSISLDKSPSTSSDAHDSQSKKQKTVLSSKNPVAVLNEIRQGLQYKLVKQEGPVHAPTFTYTVTIDNETYTGRGRNKKLAKAAAANKALASFIQFPTNNTNVYPTQISQEMDFTNDDIVSQNKAGLNTSNNSSRSGTPTTPINAGKGPVMTLNELHPNLKYEFDTLDDGIYKFKVTVEVRNKVFTGIGENKKNAKAAAARAALSKLYNMSATSFLSPMINSYAINSQNSSLISQHLADLIGNLVLTKFNELIPSESVHAKRKVIAGIVQTNGYSAESAKLISVATGTKCISGEYLSIQGAVVNDTHAEIVARRCLLLYLYSQLESFSNSGGKNRSSSSIFEMHENGGYALKNNIKFHLYINTAPCGDARIFSPHELTTSECIDKHPNRKARGLLRTKIESGEGTIPVSSGPPIQTWDGVMQGERLLTMSCSDKICRWNVVGVQGALLSNYIEPIYLDSIILGSLMHPLHMNRAIYGRIEPTIQGLPPPFRLNKPNTSLLTSSEVRRATKAPNFSVNWTVGFDDAEILNSVTGKIENGGTSRICKQVLFRKYMSLVNHLKPLNSTAKPVSGPVLYQQAKQTARDYTIAKNQLFDAFERAGLGKWVKKPIEQDLFELEMK